MPKAGIEERAEDFCYDKHGPLGCSTDKADRPCKKCFVRAVAAFSTEGFREQIVEICNAVGVDPDQEVEEAARRQYRRYLLQPVSAAAPTIPEPAAAGQGDGWKNDPSADERWNAGLDYGQTQLCAVLGVDPASVSWDAATETLDGDVRSVIGNILTAWAGDDWRDVKAAEAPTPQRGDRR